MDVGGSQITEYFKNILLKKGFKIESYPDILKIKEIKEKFGFIALNYEEEIKKKLEIKKFNLSENQIIDIENECFMICEALLNPKIIGSVFDGLVENIYNSIGKCKLEFRNELLDNIVLSGGCALFPGLKERIFKELKLKLLQNKKINIVVPNNKFTVFEGGCIFANSDNFEKVFIYFFFFLNLYFLIFLIDLCNFKRIW
jgi:actin-related protein